MTFAPATAGVIPTSGRLSITANGFTAGARPAPPHRPAIRWWTNGSPALNATGGWPRCCRICPLGCLSGLFWVQQCLETDLRAALIAQGVPCRKCRDLLQLSDKLRDPIPGWRPDPATLNTLTQAALAYLDPGADHPEPAEDMAWALAQASPLRDVLRRWFDSLPAAPDGTDA